MVLLRKTITSVFACQAEAITAAVKNPSNWMCTYTGLSGLKLSMKQASAKKCSYLVDFDLFVS